MHRADIADQLVAVFRTLKTRCVKQCFFGGEICFLAFFDVCFSRQEGTEPKRKKKEKYNMEHE